jgi:hypothetical protein
MSASRRCGRTNWLESGFRRSIGHDLVTAAFGHVAMRLSRLGDGSCLQGSMLLTDGGIGVDRQQVAKLNVKCRG